MKIKRPPTPLRKKASRGFQGYPVATVSFYGPDDQRASKIAVGILEAEVQEPTMQLWFSDTSDLRNDPAIEREILNFIREHEAKTVAMTRTILGCPHEEGIDYPEGAACPRCPFWAGKDRLDAEFKAQELAKYEKDPFWKTKLLAETLGA